VLLSVKTIDVENKLCAIQCQDYRYKKQAVYYSVSSL